MAEARIERLNVKCVAYAHGLGQSPEENALNQILAQAAEKGLTQNVGARLFGRNTYPTDKPEPHGYEYYLTSTEQTALEPNQIPQGLYAVLRFQNLFTMQDTWMQLMK